MRSEPAGFSTPWHLCASSAASARSIVGVVSELPGAAWQPTFWRPWAVPSPSSLGGFRSKPLRIPVPRIAADAPMLPVAGGIAAAFRWNSGWLGQKPMASIRRSQQPPKPCTTTLWRKANMRSTRAHLSHDEDAPHGHRATASCAEHSHGAGARCCHAQPGQRPVDSKKAPARGWQSPRCAGITTLWVTAGVVVPPPAAPAARADLIACGWVAVGEPALVSCTQAPPGRPPCGA